MHFYALGNLWSNIYDKQNLENELNAIIQMSLALINILRGQMDYAIDDKSKFIARHILSAAGSILNYC